MDIILQTAARDFMLKRIWDLHSIVFAGNIFFGSTDEGGVLLKPVASENIDLPSKFSACSIHSSWIGCIAFSVVIFLEGPWMQWLDFEKQLDQ